MIQRPTTAAAHGPRGADLDLVGVLAPTASRLLHTRHPRLVNKYATLHSLQNAVTMASSSVQGKANRLGDAFSQKESSSILASVCKDYDAPAKALKKGVESLHLQGMLGASYRLKEATAKRLGINGVQGGGDNFLK